MKEGVFLIMALVILYRTGNGQDQNEMLNNANKLYKQEQFRKSTLLYRELLIKRPNNLTIQYNLGNSAFRFGDDNTAINAYEKVSQSQDKKLAQISFYNLGVVFVKRKSFEDAIKAFKNAVILNNNDKAAKENLQFTLNLLRNQSSSSKGNNGKNDSNQKYKNQESKKKLTGGQLENKEILSSIQKEEEKVLNRQKLNMRTKKEEAIHDW